MKGEEIIFKMRKQIDETKKEYYGAGVYVRNADTKCVILMGCRQRAALQKLFDDGWYESYSQELETKQTFEGFPVWVKSDFDGLEVYGRRVKR